MSEDTAIISALQPHYYATRHKSSCGQHAHLLLIITCCLLAVGSCLWALHKEALPPVSVGHAVKVPKQVARAAFAGLLGAAALASSTPSLAEPIATPLRQQRRTELGDPVEQLLSEWRRDQGVEYRVEDFPRDILKPKKIEKVDHAEALALSELSEKRRFENVRPPSDTMKLELELGLEKLDATLFDTKELQGMVEEVDENGPPNIQGMLINLYVAANRACGALTAMFVFSLGVLFTIRWVSEGRRPFETFDMAQKASVPPWRRRKQATLGPQQSRHCMNRLMAKLWSMLLLMVHILLPCLPRKPAAGRSNQKDLTDVVAEIPSAVASAGLSG